MQIKLLGFYLLLEILAVLELTNWDRDSPLFLRDPLALSKSHQPPAKSLLFLFLLTL